jgi:hypothetical protein
MRCSQSMTQIKGKQQYYFLTWIMINSYDLNIFY